MEGRFSAALAVFLSALTAAPAAGQEACPAPDAPVAQPYRWYPKLDLARIPFHVAAGPWGARAPIAAPSAPVTGRNVLVNSAADFAAEAARPGTQITVTAQFVGPVTIASDVQDLDIVVPPGHRIAQLTIGRYAPPSATQRVRIRGTSPGRHSGGVVGSIVFASTGAIRDIIIDGVDLNGADGRGGNLLWQFVKEAERVAIVNVRGHGVGPGSLGGGTDMVIAGNRILSAARSREENGYPEGWGIRAGGTRIAIFDNRIDGTRYHRIRVHPEPGAPQYAWVANNTFVDPNEGRILSAFNYSGTNQRFAALWGVCNKVYAHSTCLTPSFDGQHAAYATLTHNAFFGNLSRATQQTLQSIHGSGRDYLTGNTFSPWRAPPPWDGPGDPTVVPLPPIDPSRQRPAGGGLHCPPPS